MKKFDVVSVGGATRDIIFYTQAGKIIATPEDLTRQKMIGFEFGAKIKSKRVHFGLGGGGCNTAICFSRLGLDAANIVSIGKDKEGDGILEHLKKEEVDTRFIKITKEFSTGFSLLVIELSFKEHVAFLYRGANDYLTLTNKDLKKVKSDWLYLSSLTGRDWQNTVSKLINLIKKNKAKLAWNPGETQLRSGKKGLNRLLKFTNILILNKDESIELVLNYHGRINGINDPRVLLKTIHKWGPKIFVLTNGRRGAYAYDGKKIYFSNIHPSKIIDTTGAGDCFGSSFLAGIILFKGDIEKAIRLGIRNTSSLVSKEGAQSGLLFKKDLKRIFSAGQRKIN